MNVIKLQNMKVGVSDNVIMSSRDGRHWDRPFLESWVKPGLDQRNWTQRNLIVAELLKLVMTFQCS